ncbi:PREDICTED: protein S100-A13-like [Elephantulus edwardii]|uniref:protein S100-A13-like n=1 Tax=Elephantulus edwardii TaxID=28737 RepID=UPI0003F07F66|nr:PREDICTED: protein S100-A13-like [Elephantulus edwardii]
MTLADLRQPPQVISYNCGVLIAAELWTGLEMAAETMVTTFSTFSVQKCKKGTLSLNEFKELVTEQLPLLLKDAGSLDEKMKSLDVNQDSELKFNEHQRPIGELAKEIRKEKALEMTKPPGRDGVGGQ